MVVHHDRDPHLGRVQCAQVAGEGEELGAAVGRYRSRDWDEANNVELAYVPFYGSWLNRIEAQFTAQGYDALDEADHLKRAKVA